MIIFFILFLILPVVISSIIISPKFNTSFKPRAQSAGGGGIDAIQKMIDSAKDGDTITIPAGTYSGGTALPLASKQPFANKDRGASDTCFLRIENKNITIKGNGAMLFGEGHDKPYMDPYQTRAGLCILDSKVTIEGLRVKEFQKRCVVAVDSTIVYRNGIVDGCDEGGISLLGNSSGLILNNMIVCHNFGGVMLWQNSQAKIINNTFHCSGIMFFYHNRNDDKAYAEIINNIFEGGEGAVNQVDWWKENASKLQNNKLSYNLYSKKDDCNPVLHYCKDYPGKLFGDPLYIEPVVDPRGIAAWANFGFREGSPAVGVGDPSIPGPKNLGNSGGPCAEANSSTCISFINSNIPKAYEVPNPTQIPIDNINIIPTSPNQVNQPLPTQVVPTAIVRTQRPVDTNVGTETKKETGILFVTNKSSKKMIQLLGIIADSGRSIRQELAPGSSYKYRYVDSCGANQEVPLGVLYASSEDDYGSIKYKNIIGYCNLLTVLAIE